MAVVAGSLAMLTVVMAGVAVSLRSDHAVLTRIGARVLDDRSAAEGFRPALAALGRIRWVRSLARPERVAPLVATAGFGATVDEIAGAKFLSALSVSVVGLLGPWPAPVVAPLLAAAAFRAPDLVLARIAARRRALADAELPYLLDVLAAGSSAGLGAPLALRRAAEALDGPLAAELRGVIRAVDLGRRWRHELRALGERLDLPDLRRAVAALSRTETLGASLSETMSSVADEVRETRRAAVTERARKAPVKMLFPLVFMVLPAFLLLTVVPVLLSTLRSIR